jgi:cobalt ECF transporter T component CbiQ
MRPTWIEKTLRSFTHAFSHALLSERTAAMHGLLQSLDPRVRVFGTLLFVIAVILCRRIEMLLALFGLAIALALTSRVSLRTLAMRVWLIVLAFTAIIALPAVFITPGPPLLILPIGHLTISETGLRTAGLLILRVETAATLTTVLVLCTRWNHILRALGSFHMPPEVVTMLAMTHRYIFLLLETSNQMFESRQSRAVGRFTGPQQRSMTARTAGVLMGKSIELGQGVYLAMLSRGFRGDIRLLDDFRMRGADYAALFVFFAIASLTVWIGR